MIEKIKVFVKAHLETVALLLVAVVAAYFWYKSDHLENKATNGELKTIKTDEKSYKDSIQVIGKKDSGIKLQVDTLNCETATEEKEISKSDTIIKKLKTKISHENSLNNNIHRPPVSDDSTYRFFSGFNTERYRNLAR